MKKRIICEIEYPEGIDDQWDADPTGIQAFHDTVYLTVLESLPKKLRELNAEEIYKETKEEYEYVKYLRTKLEILKSFKYIRN